MSPQRFVVAAPDDRPFNGLVLGQAKFVVKLRGVAVPVLGPLPELADVGAGKQRSVLLQLVLEDGRAFAVYLPRTEPLGGWR